MRERFEKHVEATSVCWVEEMRSRLFARNANGGYYEWQGLESRFRDFAAGHAAGLEQAADECEKLIPDTKAFARCRDNSGLEWGDKEPPTLHEIRSLSERLYKAEGRVNTQELLGHKDPRMTRVYHDPRGAEFIDVAVK